MQNEELMQRLNNAPVIAAVRDAHSVAAAAKSCAQVVFILGGDVMDLPKHIQQLTQADKRVFIHIDLVEGIGKDAAGVRFFSRYLQPYGLISTRASLLKVASDEGLKTVHRLFLLDSSSLKTGMRLIQESQSDLVEAMPGLAVGAIRELASKCPKPVIAGGMISTKQDVIAALAAGAMAVSTSTPEIWEA